MKRFGEVSEVASSFVTGSILTVDGGFLATTI